VAERTSASEDQFLSLEDLSEKSTSTAATNIGGTYSAVDARGGSSHGDFSELVRNNVFRTVFPADTRSARRP
jgi:hypothetical protein